MPSLPTVREIAAQRLSDAGPRDKTINMKITTLTARMMVEEETIDAAMLDWIFANCELRDRDNVHVDRDDVRAAVSSPRRATIPRDAVFCFDYE